MSWSFFRRRTPAMRLFIQPSARLAVRELRRIVQQRRRLCGAGAHRSSQRLEALLLRALRTFRDHLCQLPSDPRFRVWFQHEYSPIHRCRHVEFARNSPLVGLLSLRWRRHRGTRRSVDVLSERVTGWRVTCWRAPSRRLGSPSAGDSLSSHAAPWRSSRPGVAPVHFPCSKVISPFTSV